MKIYNVEQRTPEWLELKKGKIGGTRLKDVLKSNNLPLIYELIAENGSVEMEEHYINSKMQWGIDMEPIALNQYEEVTGRKVKDFGWWESDLSEIVGLSPDGASEDLTHAVEVKCPSTKVHVEYIISGRIPAAYKAQILMYYIVNEKLETLDFVSFDPRFTEKPLHILPTTREELKEEIEQAKAGLVKFLEKLEKYKLKIV